MLTKYKVKINCSIKETIEIMENNKQKAVFIVNENNVLLGIFTPGDMRRFILKCTDLTKSIEEGMNKNPITFPSLNEAKNYRNYHNMIVYPIVNNEGVLIDALFAESLESEEQVISNVLEEVPLVIMAGGKGTRLYPYTKILPKALIPIGDFTISERIVNKFTRYGCKKVFFVLNHKANMVKAYFNELEKDYEVEYVIEEKFLGTGGGLALLKGVIDKTFILSNCDILIDDDLECIYRTHKANGNKITFVCAMQNVVIPYGVIKASKEGDIASLEEKPEISFLTNTGVYIIEPEVIDELEDNVFIHLPDIAKSYIERGKKVGVFPISEQAWKDMGQFTAMEDMIKSLDTN